MKNKLYEAIHKEYLKHDSLCMLYELGHIIVDGLLYGSYAPRDMFPDDKKKYVYFQTAKVASSSIKASIYAEDIADNGSVHEIMKKRITHRWKKKYENYYKFFFVRNPYERLVSCYYNKYHEPHKYVGQKTPYKYYLFGYMRKDEGFDNFVKKLCKVPDWLAEQHFKPQYLIAYQGDRLLVDFVGKYENINEDFEVVRKKLGFKELPSFNKSNKHDWRDHYTKETAELVHNRYKKDFELFGYENEYTELLKYLEQKEK